MRLIDADKLHYHKVWIEKDQKFAVVVFAKEIDHAPTIDAEPVVRCKDCECGYNWMNDGTRKIGKCAFLVGDNQYVSADGFCNLGERKGGDSDD